MQLWTRYQLRSRDPEARKAALRKLSERRSPLAEMAAVRALDDADPAVRLAAIEILVHLSPASAVPSLIRIVRDEDPAVRERSVRALGALNSPEITAELLTLLRDSQPGVRFAAARALELQRWNATNDTEAAAWAVARHDFKGAIQFGAAAIEPLLACLNDPSFLNRRAVVLALAELGDARTTKALVAASLDPEPSVRVAAVESLTARNEVSVAVTVRKGLADSDPNVRAAAAEALGKLGDREAYDGLVEALKDAHWAVRKEAIEALSRLKDSRAQQALAVSLNDSDNDVRVAAADALGVLECPDAIEALIGSLIDPHSPVRRASATALRRIDARWESTQAAQTATAKLKPALNAGDYAVRQAAAELLQKIGSAAAGAPAPSALSHASLYRHQAAVGVFVDCLHHEERELRLAAVESLGRILDPSTESPLRRIAEDTAEDVWVRTAAEAVLVRFPQKNRPAAALPKPDAGEKSLQTMSAWREPAMRLRSR